MPYRSKFWFIGLLLLLAAPVFANAGPAPNNMAGPGGYYLGMSQAEARQAGALPKPDGDMRATISWGGESWEAMLMFQNNRLASLRLERRIDAAQGDSLSVAYQTLFNQGFLPLCFNSRHKRVDYISLVGLSPEALFKRLHSEDTSKFMTGQDDFAVVSFVAKAIFQKFQQAARQGRDFHQTIMQYGQEQAYIFMLNKSEATQAVLLCRLATLTDIMSAGE